MFPYSTSPDVHRLTIYLPEKDCDGNPVGDSGRWINEAQLLFTTLFGGCTVDAPARGMWYARHRHLFIEETTHVIHTLASETELRRNMVTLVDFFQAFIAETRQETLLFEYRAQPYFMTAQDNYSLKHAV